MVEEEDFELTMKVIVVGNGRVGKSSLITRFVKGTFSEEYKKTLGVAFLEKTSFLKSLDKEVKFQIWDTAGQEEYDELTREYYKGSSACILAFSTIDRDSFNAVQKWQKKVNEQCGSIPTILVQTKLDLEGYQAKVTENDVKELADLLNITLFRISSKQDLRVKEMFDYLANAYVKSKNQRNSNETKEIIEKDKEKEKVVFKVKEKETQKSEKNGGVVTETKEVKLGEIKKDNKKKKSEKEKKIEDQVAENEKQNELIRRNLNDEKKKKDCRIF